MSARQRKLGAAPVDVGGPGQQNTRLSPEIPGDASVNIDCFIERARPRDKEARLFLDRSRQHARNHRREFIGPLNLQRSPQGEPVTLAARDSEDGRQLDASAAGGNFTIARSFEENQAFHSEMNRRAAANGRDPGEVLIMPGLTARVAYTYEEAVGPQEQIHPAEDFAKTLAELGRAFGRLDFSQYDLDAPFPAEAVKYGQHTFRTQAENIARVAREENLSLRETVLYFEHRILNRSPGPPRRSPTRSSVDCWASRPTASSVT